MPRRNANAHKSYRKRGPNGRLTDLKARQKSRNDDLRASLARDNVHRALS